MTIRSSRLFAVTLPLVAVVLAAGYARHARTEAATKHQGTAHEIISGPATWVPFEADVMVTAPDKGEATVGKFYRRSDGSEHLYTHNKDGTRSVVSIYNIPTATYYYKLQDDQWYSAPMQLPKGGWKPTKRMKNANYTLHPYKLSYRRGEVPSVFARDGLEAYQLRSHSGDLLLEVRELNFFAVVRQAVTGRREEYTGIRVGEPPAELFEPPVGVSVVATEDPDGIVSRHPGEPEPPLPRHLRPAKPGMLEQH